MDTEHNCPSCRRPLPANAPKGLCPECLIKAGFGTGVAPEPGKPSRAPAFVPPATADIARLFPQFEVLELLGQGGMGAVYKARQPELDRFVALKILPPRPGGDAGFADRFTREARALARLSHPNIVAVHDFGQAGGLHYFVMEYVEGMNLRQLEQAGRLAPREALQIIPQICDALQFAHDEGIVHRDIKPENVMVDRKGRVKITDFGLARILGLEPTAVRLTGAKDVMGTPHYMAPEQIEHPQEVDHRADIYSLGVVFYEMLTGELPLGKFQAPSRKVQVDVRLDEVVLHALEKEPERRYQQASAVKSDVEIIAATPAGSSGREEAPAQKSHAGRDQSLVAAAAAGQESRLSRAAIWAAAWAPFFFLAFLLFFTVSRVPYGSPPGRTWFQIILSLTLLPIGLAAPFGTTILGGIAISQIRHSRGRLYGLGLAVFDALLFPLLAVNGGLIAGWSWLAHQVVQEWMPVLGRAWFSILMVGVMVTSCVSLTFVIAWAVWRAANRGPRSDQIGSTTSAVGSAPRPGSAAKIVGIAAAALILLALLVGATLLPIHFTQERVLIARHQSAQRSPIASYDAERAFPVQQKLLREVANRLEVANYRWDQLTVAIQYFVNPELAECTIAGLRKPVSEGRENGSPVQLFDDLEGALDIRHTGRGLWTVRGSGDLTKVNFTVDTAAEMGSP